MSSWQNCTIAQSARHRICPVTQGAFYKAKRKKKQASLLSFPYRFNTTLNHLLTLSVGPPSISSLFLLYSISLIPLRLPTSLFGWVMARLSRSTERRESSLIWWKHFRVWPSSPSGPLTGLRLADWKHSGNPRWSSVVLAPTWNLSWTLLHTSHLPSATRLMWCWSCASTSLPQPRATMRAGALTNWAKHSESLIARR